MRYAGPKHPSHSHSKMILREPEAQKSFNKQALHTHILADLLSPNSGFYP